MSIIGLTLVGILCYALFLQWRRRGARAAGEDVEDEPLHSSVTDMEETKEPADTADKLPPTLDFLRGLLAQLGCNILSEDDGMLVFMFGGGTFYAVTNGDSPQVFLNYPHFYSIPDDDLDAFVALQDVLNEQNKHFGPTVIYESEPEEGCIVLHAWREVFLFREIPAPAAFLRSMLHGIARAALQAEAEIERRKSRRAEAD